MSDIYDTVDEAMSDVQRDDSTDESDGPREFSESLQTDAVTDTTTLDSPVASTTPDDENPPVYGSRHDEIRPVDDEANTADDVDPRGLFRQPTTNMLRWLYRQNAEASIVVEKPVKDAFKHGYTFKDTSAADQENAQQAENWLLMQYEDVLKQAMVKARRDGFALVMWVVDDEAETAAEPVQNPQGVSTFNMITLDDLVNPYGRFRDDIHDSDLVSAQLAADNTQYDAVQLEVTQSGLVVVDDITSPDHEEFVGIMYSRAEEIISDDYYDFIHADRLQHFVARPGVDGDVSDDVYGHLEGDSVLTPIFNPLLGITKAEWALGQSLLRYTAPLHAVEIDEQVQPADGDMEEHLQQLNDQLGSLTNKSNVALPPFHRIKTVGDNDGIDPEPFLEGLINQVCTGSEITRSVLQGTQSGTVSGSSTDIKNYYNQVERLRNNYLTEKIHEAVEMVARYDPSAVPNFATSFEIDWGDLFQIDDVERAEAMRVIINAASNGVGNYLLTPNEAREVVEAEWASVDADVDLDDLTEPDFDQLDRVNTSYGKQFGEGNSPENEVEGNRRTGQNGGGREGGETTDPDDPTTQ